MIPRYIGTAASIEALTSIRGLNVEEDVLLEDADDSELVALADDTTPGTPASEASGGARYCSIWIDKPRYVIGKKNFAIFLQVTDRDSNWNTDFSQIFFLHEVTFNFFF